jgi:hypothetical protein
LARRTLRLVTPYVSIGPPDPPGVAGLAQPIGHPVLAAALLVAAAVVVTMLVVREVVARQMVFEDHLDVSWLPAEAAAAHDDEEDLDIIDFGAPPRSRPGG